MLEERDRVEEELVGAAGGREEATATLYRLQSATRTARAPPESAETLAGRLRAELARPVRSSRARRARGCSRKARVARERLAALERALAEREGLPPAARALAEAGRALVLSPLDVGPGDERAVAAALGWRAAAVVAEDAQSALEFLERARAAGLGNLGVVIGDAKAEAPIVAKEELLQATELSVTRRGSRSTRPAASSGTRARRPRPSCSSSKLGGAALEAEIDELEAAAERAIAAGVRARPASRGACRARLQRPWLPRSRTGRASSRPRARAPTHAASERAHSARSFASSGAKEVELRRAAAEAGERASAIDVELATPRPPRRRSSSGG